MSARHDLFLVSFLILFFQLAAIRSFAATVVFLTFFTNIVLLAARRPREHVSRRRLASCTSAEYRPADPSRWLVPMNAFLSLGPAARNFGWNVAGIILGALSEQLYYALSLALPPRATPA
jgi:hypothetical protein